MVAKLTLLMDLARHPQDLNLDLNLDLMAVRKLILLMDLAHKQPDLNPDLQVALKSTEVALRHILLMGLAHKQQLGLKLDLQVALKLIPLTPLTDLAHNQLDLNLGLSNTDLKLLLEVKLLLLALKPMEVTRKLILLMDLDRKQPGLNLDLPVALKLILPMDLDRK